MNADEKEKHTHIQKLEHAESQNVALSVCATRGRELLPTPKAACRGSLAYLQTGQGQSRTFIIKSRTLATGTHPHLSPGALLLASMDTIQSLWTVAHRAECVYPKAPTQGQNFIWILNTT